MPEQALLSDPDHPDAVTYRHAADAFRSKDLETVAATIGDSVSWHIPGTSWFARDFTGRDALLEFLREAMERTRGTFTLEDVYVAATDDHVLAVQRFGASLDGAAAEFDATSVMRYEDGVQVERFIHIHDIDAFDAFFCQF
jgi:ketosteroid isomerase-like protein